MATPLMNKRTTLSLTDEDLLDLFGEPSWVSGFTGPDVIAALMFSMALKPSFVWILVRR